MNKFILIFVAAVALILLALLFNNSFNDEGQVVQSDLVDEFKVEIISPPVMNQNEDVRKASLSKLDLSSANKTSYTNEIKAVNNAREEIKVELHKMYKNKQSINYESLEKVLTKMQNSKSFSPDVDSNLNRIKHNLEIAKKIAKLTQNLHEEVNGKKKLKKEVLDEIILLQKKLIVQTSFASKNRVEH